jgi:hypothetical protein
MTLISQHRWHRLVVATFRCRSLMGGLKFNVENTIPGDTIAARRFRTPSETHTVRDDTLSRPIYGEGALSINSGGIGAHICGFANPYQVTFPAAVLTVTSTLVTSVDRLVGASR